LYFRGDYCFGTAVAQHGRGEFVKGFVMALLAVWLMHGGAWAASQTSSKSGKKHSHHSKSQAKSATSRAHTKTPRARVKPTSVRRAHTAPVHLTHAVKEHVSGEPSLRSSAAYVLDPNGRTLYAKNITNVQPIASITKLMTAMVVLDAKLDLNELIEITDEDIDELKHTSSRLKIGTVLSRDDMLKLALMASENRAASALSRAYPGGRPAFIAAMNRKAADLGMSSTRFLDSTGLNRENVSTAEDLAKMVTAAHRYSLIQQYTTTAEYAVRLNNGRTLQYRNSNGLVRSDDWDIDVSKTGYISEAGRCLVMQARIAAQPIIIVLLDSWGKYTRIADANRIKKWVEGQLARPSPD
jgi:D-alanyl-D-alanine endopeptidase (penicillin-binding protein 7)